MALIKCEECGKEISDKAVNCVHCGCPIRKAHEEPIPDYISNVVGKTPNGKPFKIKKKRKKGWLILAAVVFGIMIIALSQNDQPAATGNTQATPSASVDPRTTRIAQIKDAAGITEKEAIAVYNMLEKCGIEEFKTFRLDTGTPRSHVYEMEYKDLEISVYLYDDDEHSVYEIDVWNRNIPPLVEKGEFMFSLDDFILTISEQTTLQLECQEQVKGVLVAPATAKFPSITSWRIGRQKDIATASAYVDSQNSFGANIRTEFYFKFKIGDISNYEYTILQMKVGDTMYVDITDE